MMKRITGMMMLFFLAASAQAKLVTEEVNYKQGDTPLKGMIAYDDKFSGKRPGILVVHEWWDRTFPCWSESPDSP